MSGISKQKQKYIQSLHNKKYRHQYGVFIVEGRKSIEELLSTDFEIEELFLIADAASSLEYSGKVELCTAAELSKVSFVKTNNYGLAIVKMKTAATIIPSHEAWTLAVDDINDPGNLGTIIRLADWYGIRQIYCSEQTVDCYNPKVISSTKGSFGRVDCIYTDLATLFTETQLPVFGAYLNGENVHTFTQYPAAGILLIGSESHGISPQLAEFIHTKITIPAFGQAESLNAGVATAILLDNLSRCLSIKG